MERNGRGLVEVLPQNLSGRKKERKKERKKNNNSVSLVDIRASHLPNTNSMLYCHSNTCGAVIHVCVPRFVYVVDYTACIGLWVTLFPLKRNGFHFSVQSRT